MQLRVGGGTLQICKQALLLSPQQSTQHHSLGIHSNARNLLSISARNHARQALLSKSVSRPTKPPTLRRMTLNDGACLASTRCNNTSDRWRRMVVNSSSPTVLGPFTSSTSDSAEAVAAADAAATLFADGVGVVPGAAPTDRMRWFISRFWLR